MAILKRPGGLMAPKRKILGAVAAPKKPALTGGGFGGAPKAKPKAGGAFERAAVERKKAEMKRNQPWSVSVPVGGSLEVYLLDEGEPWSRYEHQVGASKTSSGTTMPCIKDSNEACPLCAKEGKEGAYVMYYTAIIPREEYTKQGETEVTVRRFQKKLFPIKTKMSAKYQRLYEKLGSMRGVVLKISRDGKMDAKTGNDFEHLRTLTEADIQAFAKATGIKNNDTKDQILKAKIADPFDYDKLMPTPSAKDLAAMVGAKTGISAGHADFTDDDGGNDAAWGDD